VYDPSKQLESNCNMGMIGLDTLPSLQQIKNDDSAEELKALITEHYHETNSSLAKKLLTNWEQEVASFVKVIPNDYRKILEKEKALKAFMKQEEKQEKEKESSGENIEEPVVTTQL
jgi:glutamate synthase domain-containing protein 3